MNIGHTDGVPEGSQIRIIPLASPLQTEGGYAQWMHPDYTAEDILEMIQSLKPQVLERYFTGKQDMDAFVPVREGNSPMTVKQFLNASMRAGSPDCIIIPKLNLTWFSWGKEKYFWEAAENNYNLPLERPIRIINLDNWRAFIDKYGEAKLKGVLTRLKQIGYETIGVNMTGGYRPGFGMISFADFAINANDWTIRTSTLDKLKEDPDINQYYLYIDYPGQMDKFMELTPDKQADVITKVIGPASKQLDFNFVYPILFDRWDAAKHITKKNGQYKGASIFEVIQQSLNPDVNREGSSGVPLFADGSLKAEIDESTKVESAGEYTVVHGDVTLLVDESDWLIAPDSARNLEHPGPPGKFFENRWGKFPAVGYTAVLKEIEGAGCVVIIEEFGDVPPLVRLSKESISVNNCAQVRLVPFQDGGYRSVARIYRAWLKEKGYYRHILDKPFGREIAGAAAVRPVQHGAISAEVWKELQPIIPSAVMVWRQSGGPAEGLEKFTKALQADLETRGKYFFLPWGSLLSTVGEEDQKQGLRYFDFSAMPSSMVERWSWVDRNGNYLHHKDKNGNGNQQNPAANGLLCAHGQKERILHWINKVENHPQNYRMDGVNIDSTAALMRARSYPGNCAHNEHPATYKDWVAGIAAMFETAYNKGLMISHEGCVFPLEKYSLHTYGKAMVSLGIYTGWYLKAQGEDKDPEKLTNNITQHVPVNEMVYHDQLAMRVHDAEALNIRYADSDQYQSNRRIKHVFNALYGLTPNLQLGGADADRMILEDLQWMKKEMPRALKTYQKLYGLRLIDHRFLSEDHKIQKSVYEGGIKVIANFSNQDREVQGTVVPALDYCLIEE